MVRKDELREQIENLESELNYYKSLYHSAIAKADVYRELNDNLLDRLAYRNRINGTLTGEKVQSNTTKVSATAANGFYSKLASGEVQ